MEMLSGSSGYASELGQDLGRDSREECIGMLAHRVPYMQELCTVARDSIPTAKRTQTCPG